MARPPGLLGCSQSPRLPDGRRVASQSYRCRVSTLGKKRRTAIIEMPSRSHPAPSSSSISPRRRANGVSLTILFMPRSLKNAMASNAAIVSITLVPRHIDSIAVPTHRVFSGAFRARVTQRQSATKASNSQRFQKIDEERQMRQRRQRRLGIPFDKHRAGETVEDHRLRGPLLQPAVLTAGWKGGIRKFVRHALIMGDSRNTNQPLPFIGSSVDGADPPLGCPPAGPILS